MKIFSITCTREQKLGAVAKGMIHSLSSYGVSVKFLANQTSIFEAYKKGLDSCDASDEDIIILCHDDLQFLSDKAGFIAALSACVKKETGIIGPAGTTFLGEEAVWWNHERWQAGDHRGQVQHMNTVDGRTQVHSTNYGPYGQVVVLDGLFLAARKEVWDKIGLDKPDYFEGNWDFYDIHYTTKAHLLGYKNYAAPINVIHQSAGELVGRDSWHKNRQSFIENTKLPLTC